MLDLNVEQVKLEEAISVEAEARAVKDAQSSHQRTDWASSRMGIKFVKAVMDQATTEENPSYVETIRNFLVKESQPRAGVHLIAGTLLNKSGLEYETMALIAAKTILSNMVKLRTAKRSSICMFIGRAIDHEVSMRRFADSKKRKALLKKLFADFDKRTYPKEWRIRTIRNYFDAENVEWNTWEPKQHLSVGLALLTMFRNSTGLINYSSDGTWVEISDVLLDRIQDMLKNNSSMFTLYRPMVLPPKPWTSSNMFRGGYYTTKVRPYALIKGSGKRDVERLSKLDLSAVMSAVNAIQETPWRVNRRMLDAQKWAYHTYGGGIGSMEGSDEEPLPPLPHDYDTNEDVRKIHNREAFMVHDRRRRAKSKRIGVLVTHTIADEMKEYEAIYFPHNLDSRGRAYPLPAFLNPQGPDYVKALLEFSKGMPVEPNCDNDATKWLAIAGANAWGQDKVSLNQRINWVNLNAELIYSCADNYETDHRWMQASEPFQFLRFCFEWADLRDTPYGEMYMSHMVVPVDATNSGLQHYSAMLRDEVGGRSVNLIPGLSRQDIYGDVANRVIEYLMEDGGVEAHGWIKFGIDRKITKRQVMVVPYAGKFSSCLEYTRDAVVDKLNTGIEKPQWAQDPKEFSDRIVYLARLIWKAIDDTVVKGKIAMTYLSKIAGEYAKHMNKEGLPIYQRKMTWLTPDGFEVIHFREDEEMHRVKTTFEGSIFLSYYRGTGKLNPKDMALACPPNFVHALDATHLRMTVNKALGEGITDFGMVHDSFGVHAANMSAFLRDCVKPAFVQMYTEHDVIAEFAEQFKDQSANLTKPTVGSLDLQGVLKSEFFFS